jgi:hypothetical protein
MFISKVRNKESGILLYGITPPKEHTPNEKVVTLAERTVSSLSGCDIDALVVYDVQDESARTTEERPFPFARALDPFHFASAHLQALDIPKILYRPAGKFTTAELQQWLEDLRHYKFYPVFVGLPCPDYVVKTSLTEAYQLWRERHADHSVIGAVMIPERHAVLKDEEVRVLDKVSCGVSYFISQCIFEVEYAKKVLLDLTAACDRQGNDYPTMIFTLTICGSPKTLQFMEWLGIYVPEHIKNELSLAENQVTHSVAIATRIAKELIGFCKARSIPFGFNIESVAIRKEEIDASLELLNTVGELLKESGLRSPAKVVDVEISGDTI